MAEEENRVLVLVDDDPAQVRQVTSLATRAGWRTTNLTTEQDALALLLQTDVPEPDALLLDGRIAGDHTCQLIDRMRSIRPDLPILLLTNSASSLLAVQAMRAGAADYLIKPLTSERLLYALESSVLRETQKDELAPLSEKIGSDLSFDMMIGSAPNFRAALARAAKFARSHSPVLICGEAGTGKEILARAIHSASPRSRQPLHVLHVAGMAPGHIESALYGHEKGAFAGAFERRVGMLEAADGATVLIDDIERLPPSLQSRLAATIDRGEVKPMGAAHGFRIDVRVLATSCSPLDRMRENGVLDAGLCDLFSASETALPPLRERNGDISALCRHFLKLIGEQPGLRKLSISDAALALIEGYAWPGNLRQLQAVLFRAVVFCDKDTLSPNDFPQLLDIVGDHAPSAAPAAGGVTLFGADGHMRPLEEIEADVIRLAIGHYRGRMSEVARRLGIGRSTLYRKLSDLGIDNAA